MLGGGLLSSLTHVLPTILAYLLDQNAPPFCTQLFDCALCGHVLSTLEMGHEDMFVCGLATTHY